MAPRSTCGWEMSTPGSCSPRRTTMKITRERADGPKAEAAKRPQRHRRTSHNLPLWLMQPSEQQAIAQRRTLMILSVLAGQKSVQEVIEQEQVSRTFYYQLE